MVMEQIPASRSISTCKGCGSFIRDQYILRVSPDLEWHAACLRCAECGRTLDDRCTCFVRNGKTYCKSDYVRLFGAKCNRCGQSFRARDMVMRAKDKIFHVDCFRCGVCTKRLVPGDEFALKDDSIFCREDFVCSKDSGKDDTDPLPSSPGCGEDNVLVKVDKESRRREGKPTRVRTVLTEKQLHTLRTCYNANPRPDALMKEQMVEMTGLSPRVIRVWFQNKRCKDKKRQIYLRQIQEANKEGRHMGGLLPAVQGVHMIAAPPVRHSLSETCPVPATGPDLCQEPVDIMAYQPPWTAFHEMARQPDVDTGSAQFQSLYSQMHGFGVESHVPELSPAHSEQRVSDAHQMPRHQGAGNGPGIKYELDAGSDSYVSYLESDDSINTSSP